VRLFVVGQLSELFITLDLDVELIAQPAHGLALRVWRERGALSVIENA
jgi:hypothetical protein